MNLKRFFFGGERLFHNPRMPLKYYNGSDPNVTFVVIREHVRRLPAVGAVKAQRVAVRSKETEYKRLKRPVAPVIRGTWESKGEDALKFEVARGGGPAVSRNRVRTRTRTRSNPSENPGIGLNTKIFLYSAIALFATGFFSKFHR